MATPPTNSPVPDPGPAGEPATEVSATEPAKRKPLNRRQLRAIAWVLTLAVLTMIGGVLLLYRHDRQAASGELSPQLQAALDAWSPRGATPTPPTNERRGGLAGWVDPFTRKASSPPADLRDSLPVPVDGSRWIYIGETTHQRWGRMVEGKIKPWPPDLHLNVYASASMLLASTATPGRLPAREIGVTTTSDGYFEFEIRLDEKNDFLSVAFIDPIKRELIGDRARPRIYNAGWRLPALPTKVEMRTPEIRPFEEFQSGKGRERFGPPAPRPAEWHIVWTPLPPPIAVYMLEIERPDRPGKWVTVGEAEYQRPGIAPVEPAYPTIFPGYRGPLNYRITPVNRMRPEGASR